MKMNINLLENTAKEILSEVNNYEQSVGCFGCDGLEYLVFGNKTYTTADIRDDIKSKSYTIIKKILK